MEKTTNGFVKRSLALVAGVLAVLFLSGAGFCSQECPKLNFGYIFTTHHAPFIVAMAKGEDFSKQGIWLKPVVPKEKYDLISNGKTLARLHVIVSKSGSETTTLFAQNRLDAGLASVTAMMTGIDRGTDIKVLAPMHVDGMGLVFPADRPLDGWEEVLAYIHGLKRPLKVGYHSPTSAPRIVIEGALSGAGLKVTMNPNDFGADVLLVNVKTTRNLIPALTGGQVDCWVGPAPYPEVAEEKGVGHIALDLKHLPPEGQWKSFPCCVMGARSRVMAENPDVLKALTRLLTVSAAWCNTHRDEMGALAGDWLGIPADAVKKSTIHYTTRPSENWMKGVDIYLGILNKVNKLSGAFKGKTLDAVEKDLFDFRFTENR